MLAASPFSAMAADVSGTWKAEFDSQIGVQKYTYTFKQDGTAVTGKASSETGEQKREAELKEGKIVDDTLTFVEMLKFQENEIRITYTGKLTTNADEIKVTREVGDVAKEEIVLKREQAAQTAKPIRIKAGSSAPFTDSSGNVWEAEQGFEGGETIERPGITIANTKEAGLFQSEHYSMNSFSTKVPNGKYEAKLYFAETFEGITGAGQRVFSFSVQGHEFKDFDVFAKAGGANRAYIETVPVEVTDGTFKVTFTSNLENPQINAIELVPQTSGAPGGSASAVPATLTGDWQAGFETQRGLQKYTFTLKEDGTNVTVKAAVEMPDQKRDAEFKDAKVDGDTLTFSETIKVQDNEMQILFTGKISAKRDEIKFTRKVGDFGSSEATAKRISPAAESPMAKPAGS